MEIKINEDQLKLLIEHIITERYDDRRRGKRSGKRHSKKHEVKRLHNKNDKGEKFWGEKGAGALILCPETKRFLLPLRSKTVDEGGTWGTWGGAIDGNENPMDAVAREFKEEAKYRGNITFHPLCKFEHDSGFVYYNFIGIVDKEFRPIINWETERAEWREIHDFPTNLHFGVKNILSNSTALEIISKFIKTERKTH